MTLCQYEVVDESIMDDIKTYMELKISHGISNLKGISNKMYSFFIFLK